MRAVNRNWHGLSGATCARWIAHTRATPRVDAIDIAQDRLRSLRYFLRIRASARIDKHAGRLSWAYARAVEDAATRHAVLVMGGTRVAMRTGIDPERAPTRRWAP